MRFALLIFLWTASVGFSLATSDDIDDLVSGLDGLGLWTNGIFQPIDLPPDASTEKVVAQIMNRTGSRNQNDPDEFRNYHIAKIKKVFVPPENPSPLTTYTAVLLESARGSKSIILMKYEGNSWWHRMFSITTVP